MPAVCDLDRYYPQICVTFSINKILLNNKVNQQSFTEALKLDEVCVKKL